MMASKSRLLVVGLPFSVKLATDNLLKQNASAVKYATSIINTGRKHVKM